MLYIRVKSAYGLKSICLPTALPSTVYRLETLISKVTLADLT